MQRFKLSNSDHFMRLKILTQDGFKCKLKNTVIFMPFDAKFFPGHIPQSTDILLEQVSILPRRSYQSSSLFLGLQHYTDIEICQKSLKTATLTLNTGEEEPSFGTSQPVLA